MSTNRFNPSHQLSGVLHKGTCLQWKLSDNQHLLSKGHRLETHALSYVSSIITHKAVMCGYVPLCQTVCVFTALHCYLMQIHFRKSWLFCSFNYDIYAMFQHLHIETWHTTYKHYTVHSRNTSVLCSLGIKKKIPLIYLQEHCNLLFM